MTNGERGLKIGVDLSCWTNQRGYGRYTRNIVNALVERDGPHQFVGFVDATTAIADTIPNHFPVVSVRQSEPPSQAARAYGRRGLRDIWNMSRAVTRANVDVMFFPSSYSYFPVPPRMRCVVVVHDAIAERWPKLIFPTLSGRIAWTIKSRLACWQADRVVTVSMNAGKAIRDHLGVSEARLRVVYEAADPVFGPREATEEPEAEARRRYGLPTDKLLLLYVGGLSPHKNLGALLAAMARLTANPDDRNLVHLALVGETEREVFYSAYHQLAAQVRQLGLGERVTFTGYVPDVDLVHLYRSAACLILPSRDEGFGLPVVEAMTCGSPVVASRAGALPELVGDAGLLVNPDNVEEFARALHRITHDPGLRRELGARGLRRASELSWNEAARNLLSIFHEVADASAGAVTAR